MIEQTGNDAVVFEGLTTERKVNALGGKRPLEKLTEDRNPKIPKKPRRFSYPSGSTILDGYTIKRGIGIGGFGEVYFGISDAGKEVALKRVQRNLDVELRGVSQCLNLKHVNLISLWDIRQDTEGESWVIMEYVPGDSLRDILEKNPRGVSIEEAKSWFTQILNGVSYLHDHGIVHRDLKPGNIFHDRDENVVKIGDYGLSKFISTSKRDGQTESVGTFHYMAPEIGKGSYGKEIDVYSLGIILCEILTGRVPFDGESGQEIIMKHLTATPELGFVDSRFHAVILRALAKDPNERFSSVREMMDAINWNGGGTAISSSNANSKPQSSPEFQKPTVIEPMFIDDPAPNKEAISENQKEDLFYIEDEGIQLGEVKQYRGQSGVDSEGWSEAADGGMRMSQVKPTKVPVALDQPSQNRPSDPVVASKVFAQSEPIAAAVGNGYQTLTHWWQGIAATPLKVLMVVGLALFILLNAKWLMPLSILLGCAYMVYFLVRTRNLNRESKNANQSSTTIRPFSRADCLKMVEQKMREGRLKLPVTEKLAEVLGSTLVSTIVIGVSLLVALGFSGFALDGSVGTIAVFTWLFLTTLMGAVTFISVTKIFETSVGNHWSRRFVLMAVGLPVGALSFAIHQGLLIDSVVLPDQVSGLANSEVQLTDPVGLMTFMTFFAALFLVVRWWRVGDALRSSQFSILIMILHVVIAIAVAMLTLFPMIWALIIGGTLSIAVQLSSTWIKADERERIQFEVMQTISA